jgi:drug/metabolite transporter (DMT)-like permease
MQALWMLVASLFFASMAVCVKFASAWFNSAELVFWRGLIGMVLMWLWARSRGEVALRTRYPGMHAGAAWSACCRWAPGSTPSPACRWPRP